MRKITQKWASVLMTLLCLVGMSQVVMAQDCVVIGAGTTAGSGSVPVASWYHYSYTQQLFLADEINHASGNITSIAFQYNDASSMTRKISIFMANTSEATMSSDYIREDLTEVLSPTVVTFDNSAEWVVIDLETPFAYAGDNLVLAIYQEQSAEETLYSSGSRFLTFASTGLSRYNQSDSQFTLGEDNAPTATGAALSYRTNTQFCIVAGGGGPTCAKPSVEVTAIGARQATISWDSQTSTTFTVEYQKSTDGDKNWTPALVETTDKSIVLNNLAANTSYNVRVLAYCGDAASDWAKKSFTTLCKTPFEENFDGTSLPKGWSQSLTLLSDVIAGGTLASGGAWNFGAGSNGDFFDNHARLNVYGSSCKSWLITPEIEVTADAQLTFSVALTKYSGTAVAIAPGQQTDDKFVVLVTADGGATWTILQQWDNAGSENVYDDIATTGEDVTIELGAGYIGQRVKIAFYGESTESGGDNNLHIDNIRLGAALNCQPPTNLREVEGTASKNSVQLAWDSDDATAWIVQYSKKSPNWESVIATDTLFTLTGLDEFSTYQIRVAALCDPDDEDTQTSFSNTISITTATGLPYAQGFCGTSTTFPAAWKRYSALWGDVQNGDPLQEVTTGWSIIAKASANNVFPDSARHMVLNIKDSTMSWVVSPAIAMEAGNQLTFDLALTKKSGANPTQVVSGEQDDDQFIVFVFANGQKIAKRTWSANSGLPFDEISYSDKGEQVKIDLSEYDGQIIQIAFYGESTVSGGDNNLHISNVKIDSIPNCSPAASLVIADVEATTASAIWTYEETGVTWEYGYKANPAADFVPADADFEYTTTEKAVALTGLSQTTDYVFFVRQSCGADTKSDVKIEYFTTLQEAATLPYENNFETENGWLLINGNLTNKWVWDESLRANNTPNGSKALYISNDNAGTYAYTNNSATMVYAVKNFYFGETGMYSFSFDWKAYGYSTLHYLRAMLIPAATTDLTAGTTTPTGFSATALPAAWEAIALDGGSQLNLDSAWNHQLAEIQISTVGYYNVVFAWRNSNSTSGKNPPAAIDNIKIARITCPRPTGLAVADITDSGASFSWDDEAGASWVYAIAPATAAEPAIENFIAITENAIQLENLTENTAYKFYLRKNCGEEGYSLESVIVPFHTKQMPVAVGASFSDNFEEGNGWLFVNGDLENAWVYGTAAHNGTGTHALYISNDNGETNAYTNTKAATVFATKAFSIAKGNYIFSYDWIANGESNYDLLRVALIPDSIELEASSAMLPGLGSTAGTALASALPANWIALDGGSKLNLKTAWQTYTTAEIAVQEGTYKVVFLWRNDGSGGSQTPAAVDNFSITKVACATPVNLHAIDSLATASAAVLTWEPQSAEENWVIRYKKYGAEAWADSVYASNDTITLEGLEHSTLYEAQVATQCDPEDAAAIGTYSSSVTFATACVAVATIEEGFEDLTKLLCWQLIADGSSPAISTTASKAFAGNNALYFLSTYSATQPAKAQYAILPELISLDNMRIKFQARKEDDTDEDVMMYVGVMTNPAADTTFVAVDSFLMTSNTYAPYIVPFTGYTGDGKFVAIKMPGSTVNYATLLIDELVVEEIPQCMDPTDVHAEQITPKSALLRWTPSGTEADWLVRYKMSGDEAWADTIHVSADSMLFEGLKAATTYEAQVAAWCDPQNEEAVSPYSSSASFKTPNALPIEEPFDATTIPTGWSRYSGLLADVLAGSANLTTTTSGWTFGSVNGVFDSHAKTNIYGTGWKYWLVTPEVYADGNVQLTFDLALTKYSGTKVAVETGQQADDKFVVLISTNAGATWTILRQWDNVGAEYVYDNIATNGEQVAISLAAYSGQPIMVAFYGESTVSGGDNNLHIDNVVIDVPQTCLKPTGLAISNILSSSVKASWDNEEGAAWKYAVALASAAEPAVADFIAVADSSIVVTELTENTDYIFYLVKDCGEDDLSRSIFVPFHTANACQSPTDLAADDITVSSAVISWNTYNQTGFNLRYGIDGENWTVLSNVTTPCTISNLENNTAYKVQVQVACAAEDEWSAVYTFKTIRGIPFEEKFNATTIPTDWKQYSGLLSDVLGGATLSSGSSWYFGAGSNGNFFDSHARVNIYGTSAKYWLATPAVFIEGDVQLTFDVALTKYSGTAVAVDPAQQQDDKFAVVISTDNGTTWTVLRQWDNAGSAYVYNNIATTGEQVAISLASYSGEQIMVAFYGESTVSGGDNNLHIDNVAIDLVPTCLKPKAVAISDIKAHTAKIEWTAGAEETAWQIAIDTIAGFKPDTLSNLIDVTATDTPYVFNGLEAAHTYYVYVRANCGEQDGVSRWTDKASFTTTIACPAVKNLAVSDITPASAVISWKAGQDENAWQVAYDFNASDEPESLSTLTTVEATTYALAELGTDTTYHVYVRANCGEADGSSTWSHISFKTAKACQTPDNITFSEITTTSAKVTWNTYGQTGFNLRYSTDGQNWTDMMNVTCPMVLSGLEAGTQYRVKVQAACEDADSWSLQANFKTVIGVPFEEKFNTTSLPSDWLQQQGLLSDVLGGASLTSGTAWYFGSSNGVFDSHARVNIYGTSRKHWLITPAVYVEGNVQLTFDLALTAYSGTGAASGDCSDDKFAVVISTDNGTTWTVLRQWDNAGSAYVYNNIATTGEQVAISLAAYSGQSIMVAFYGESTATGGDNNLHIDNVLIDLVPTCLKPTNLNVSNIMGHKATLAWTAGEQAQTAWQIAIDTIAGFKPDTLSNLIDVTENPYTLTGLNPSTTYYVYVRANCGEQDGVSRWTDMASFTTTVACPAPKNLEAVLTPGDGSVATMKWQAGGEEAAWKLEYSLNADMSDSTVVSVENTTYELTGLNVGGTYYVRVQADCGELDGESAYTAVVSFTTTNEYLLTINDKNTSTNEYVPVYGWYADNYSLSQFIIPETQLEEIEWDTIQSMTFYASNESVEWGLAEFEVYMAEAQDATIGKFADWDALTQVKSGSLSVSGNKMVVTLDEPYCYQGGNLLIGFKQTVSGDDQRCYWYGVSATGASYAGYKNSYGSITASQRNFLPKMTFKYVPGVAPACPNPKYLEVSDITASSATFSWKAVAGATWEYALVEQGAGLAIFHPTTENTLTIDNLEEGKTYVFYLRRACGEGSFSDETLSVEFTTLEFAQTLPYVEDFENAQGWKLFNDANAWMIGTAASDNGENALYISNDGASYDYDELTASVSYATKLFNFASAGTYTVQYDWKNVGDYDDESFEEVVPMDYMRAALVPADFVLTAGVQPEGLAYNNLPANWIALDTMALYAQEEWQHMSIVVPVPAAGNYRVVFAWINPADEYTFGVPAAIDNLSIVHKDWPTDIEGGAGIETKAIKFMKNNHVYILVNGVVYNITGQKVEVK